MGKKPRDGFYKRDGSPYWWTRDPVTKRRCSTGYRDLDAARKWRAARERVAADPAHAAAEAATLGEWCGRFVAWKEKSSSAATVSVARQKLGHWIRVFGASCSLSCFSEPIAFDAYVTKRRAEKASDHTISKEVAHMLAVLKLAKRAKCFSGDLSTLRPPDLHAGYKPRERTLTRAELAALLSELKPHRAVWVAVGVALGCRLGEVSRMLPTDIDWTEERVLIRGTKTAGSRRYLPILSLYRPLLEAAAPYLPVKPWGKIWRDIGAACKRAGIAHCSTNDFRRTHATLLAEADVSPDVIRRLLGHTTDTLVKQVYARPSAKALATLAEGKLLGAAPLLPEKEVAGAIPAAVSTAGGSTPSATRMGASAQLLGEPEEPPTSTPPEPSQPKGENGGCVPKRFLGDSSDPSGLAGEPDASNSEPVTAWRDTLILSTNVTIELLEESGEFKSQANSSVAPVAQWIEQRFPKALPGATWADPAGFSGCAPLGAAGFGQIPTGQLVIDVTSNWGAS